MIIRALDSIYVTGQVLLSVVVLMIMVAVLPIVVRTDRETPPSIVSAAISGPETTVMVCEVIL